MKVKVEACWSGGDNHYFRLTMPDGSRESVTPDEPMIWSRKTATEALNVLESVYHVERRKVRFDHY
jgi:hypothetical protein